MIFWIVIGAAFFNLANKYGKNRFLYLGIGVGLTLATQFIVGIIYGLIVRPTQEEIDHNSLAVNLIALAISGIITYVVYRILKNKAEKEHEQIEESINSFGAEVVQDKAIGEETH